MTGLIFIQVVFPRRLFLTVKSQQLSVRSMTPRNRHVRVVTVHDVKHARARQKLTALHHGETTQMASSSS